MLGYILYITSEQEDKEKQKIMRITHYIVGTFIDILRSIPFIILMLILIPLTVIIMGTMLGPKAALLSLIISAAPFYARVSYNALLDVDKGNVEALNAMGASKFIKIKILFREALSGLIKGLTVTLVSLVGFIAAAGAVGAGGLGDLARRRALALDYKIMYISVILLLIIVVIIQIIGDIIAKKIDRR
jgi:D-methionine transport system permease protein